MSNARRGAFALATLALITGSAPRPVLAAGSTPTRTVVPYAEIRTNPCTGEVVTLVGETVLFASTKLSRNGLMEATFRIKNDGEGSAASAFDGLPVKYGFRSDETTKFGDFANGGIEVVLVSKSLLVRKGELGEELPTEDDWLMKDTLRVKIDQYGNVVVNRTALAETCGL